MKPRIWDLPLFRLGQYLVFLFGIAFFVFSLIASVCLAIALLPLVLLVQVLSMLAAPPFLMAEMILDYSSPRYTSFMEAYFHLLGGSLLASYGRFCLSFAKAGFCKMLDTKDFALKS